MLVLLALLLANGAVAQLTHYLYGPQWGWYSIRTNAHIVSLETTLHPNAPPNPAQRRLALWPGMNVGRGLIQPIIVSSPESLYQGKSCGGATTKDWCVFASMYTGGTQAMGKRAALGPTDSLRMKFQYDDSLGGYNQWLYIKDQMVSDLHRATGKAKSFYVSTECQAEHKGLVNDHTYVNTTLVFSQPVPDLDKQVNMGYMACADSITTPDGGKTWKIGTIRLEKSQAPDQYKRTAQTSRGSGLCGK